MKNAVLLKESNDSIRQPSFTCDLCGIKMKMKESLESHFNKLHILKFICKGCCKAYSCKASLLKHLKTHFEKYVCHYCGAEISTYENFQRHVYLKHEPDNTQLILSTQPRSNYHCRFCIRIFPTAVHRNSHERMIHKKRSSPAFVCQSCNLIFLTKEELRSHSFQHYSGMLYVCPIEACDKFFKTSRQLRNHTMIHNSPKFTCNNCNRKFHQSSNYSKHKKRCVKHSMLSKSKDDLDNISSKAKMQYAELCTNKLKHSKKEKTIPKKNIEIHSFKLKPHTNKKSASSKIEIIAPPKRVEEFVEMNVQKNFQHTVFSMTNCDSKNKTNILQNQRVPKNKQFLCDSCGGTTNSLLKLRKHMKLHISNQKQNCDCCQQKVKCRLKHLKMFNSDERKFQCNLCEKHFKSKNNLKNHLKIHEKPEECSICNKFLPNIERHIKWHKQRSKTNIFLCLQCNKNYSTKQVLNEHIQRIHEKKPIGKIYSCQQCKLTFIRNCDLRRHAFIHYTGKIHSCSFPDCNEMFKTSVKLHSHMIIHNPHAEANFECQFCKQKYYRQTSLKKHQKKVHNLEMVK